MDTTALLMHTNMGILGVETGEKSVQARVPLRNVSTQANGGQPCKKCSLCPLLVDLIQAANGNDEAKLDKAIAAGASIDLFFEGWAPLHHLAALGNCEGIRLLLSKGADVAQRAARHQPPIHINHSRGGETPLHVAVRNGHRNAVRLLIKSGAPLEVYDGASATGQGF